MLRVVDKWNFLFRAEPFWAQEHVGSKTPVEQLRVLSMSTAVPVVFVFSSLSSAAFAGISFVRCNFPFFDRHAGCGTEKQRLCVENPVHQTSGVLEKDETRSTRAEWTHQSNCRTTSWDNDALQGTEEALPLVRTEEFLKGNNQLQGKYWSGRRWLPSKGAFGLPRRNVW